jgi:hypothetical protein
MRALSFESESEKLAKKRGLFPSPSGKKVGSWVLLTRLVGIGKKNVAKPLILGMMKKNIWLFVT